MNQRLKLSFSNKAWSADRNEEIYRFLERNLCDAIDLAPSHVYEAHPYSQLESFRDYAWRLKESHNLFIASIQDIWEGKEESIFRSVMEQDILLDYTRRAAEFAVTGGAINLIFDCAKNRAINEKKNSQQSGMAHDMLTNLTEEEAVLEKRFYHFVNRILDGSNLHFAMQAVPENKGNHYLTTTESVIKKVEQLRGDGFKNIGVCLDLATMLEEGSDLQMLRGKVHLLSHVRVCEPDGGALCQRPIHQELFRLLREENYQRYVAVAIAPQNSNPGYIGGNQQAQNGASAASQVNYDHPIHDGAFGRADGRAMDDVLRYMMRL